MSINILIYKILKKKGGEKKNMNQNKKISKTNKLEDSENKDITNKKDDETILKRVSIYQIKTKHPMFSYADSNTFYGKNLYMWR